MSSNLNQYFTYDPACLFSFNNKFEKLQELQRIHFKAMDSTQSNKVHLIQESFAQYVRLAREMSGLPPAKCLSTYSPEMNSSTSLSEASETKSSCGSIDICSTKTEFKQIPKKTEIISDSEVTETFGRVSLKFFMNEQISTEDFTKLDKLKLSNFRKLIYVKYQKLIDITFFNQIAAKNGSTIERTSKNAKQQKKRRKLQVSFQTFF